MTKDLFQIDYVLTTGPKGYCPILVSVCKEDFEKVIDAYFKSNDCYSVEKQLSDNYIQIIYYSIESDSVIGFQVQHKL